MAICGTPKESSIGRSICSSFRNFSRESEGVTSIFRPVKNGAWFQGEKVTTSRGIAD